MAEIEEIVQKYKSAEKDRTFPFSEWHRGDIFEKLIKDFLVTIGYNPDQINYADSKGTVELGIRQGLKAIVYLSSIQEGQRFLNNKISASIDTIPHPESGKPEYEMAVVTNFEKWFFYFDGKEIYAVSAEKLEKEYDALRGLISKDAIESGRFKEIARKLLHKEDNEPLRQELNVLRGKIADEILQERINIEHLKNPDDSFNNELLNAITTRWITRFLALKLAEDSEISFNFTLRDIRRSFELKGRRAELITGAKVKEETLNNAIRSLMNEFERRYNGGIFMYEEGVDYLAIPDTAFFDLLDFAIGWAFTIEDARIIGFVYERFLGQEIAVEERKGKLSAVLKNIGEARGRRKAGGIYYTPKYIVDYIVENTLGEILKDKKKGIDHAIKNLDCDMFLSALREVKFLKVLDPACGSGSFLIRVLAEFKNFYEEIKEKIKEVRRKIDVLRKERIKGQTLFIEDKEILDLEDKYFKLKKEIDEIKYSGTFALRYNIYGVDLDPKAIDITAFTLMVQVYDELKDGARCPTIINENLKVGNSLVSIITPDKRNDFISRKQLEKFNAEIGNLIELRRVEGGIDVLDVDELKELVEKNFNNVVEIYLHIKERYPNAIPTSQQKLLDEWYKKSKKEPIEKTYDVLINQTGLARIFLKEVYFEKISPIKEKIENEINEPLIKYFNPEKRVLKDKELEEILEDEERVKEGLRFVKDRAMEISKSQPPKAFNWEIEFPEVFFNEDGTLKENPGFDCVAGNPPWGRIKQFPEKVEKELLGDYLGNVYTLQVGNLNLYKLFLEQSYLSLKNYGFFSMIFPTPFLGENNSKLLRREFFQNTKITKILEFPESTEVFGRENTQDVTVMCYKKGRTENDYILEVATNIGKKDLQNLSNIKFLSLTRSEIKEFSDVYQIPIFQDPQQELKVLKKISQIPPFKGDDKILPVGEVGEGHLHETFDKGFLSKKPTGDLVIKGIHLDRYYVNLDPNGPQPRWVKKKEFLKKKPIASQVINSYTATGRNTQNRAIRPRLSFVTLPKGYVLTNAIKYFIPKDVHLKTKYVIGLLNSTVLNWRFELFSTQNNIRNYEIEDLPIARATPDQQAPIISLVDTIIQKKKEYHAISQNIEDYIRFEDLKIERFEDFLKGYVEDFSVISSVKVKTDNFDALRIRFENNDAILEYGIRRKVEEYEVEDDEEAAEEIKGKYVIDWTEAWRGEIKNREAIEFLAKIIEKEKRISKSTQKTIWQKIAEVKVPEFSDRVKIGFLKFKSTLEKTKQLDEEITKIDRAIDRLVYEFYGLTEDEIKVVEKSVWGEMFEEMYGKLLTKDSALRLSESYRGK